MKKGIRALAVTATALIAATSMFVFAGCDTDYPEVTITYEFNGERYEVDYMLTRKGAPQTVRHFIELADAGYYNGTVIHDYAESGLFLHGGGYVLDEDGDLQEKDYWTEVKRLEEAKNFSFTQSVYWYNESEEQVPMYTVVGEFISNGVDKNGKSYRHTQAGTLVMDYMDKGDDNTYVSRVRSDDGEIRDWYQYKYNSATSMFYTFTSTGGSRTDLDSEYCAFGRTKDFSQLQALITAVNKLAGERDESDPLIQKKSMVLNQYDPFESVRTAKITVDYSVPDVPITIVSVKVNKY